MGSSVCFSHYSCMTFNINKLNAAWKPPKKMNVYDWTGTGILKLKQGITLCINLPSFHSTATILRNVGKFSSPLQSLLFSLQIIVAISFFLVLCRRILPLVMTDTSNRWWVRPLGWPQILPIRLRYSLLKQIFPKQSAVLIHLRHRYTKT